MRTNMKIYQKYQLSRCGTGKKTPCSSGLKLHTAPSSEGTSLIWPERERGSVSVEAALVLPVFMICILGLFSVLNYLRVYGSMLSQLKEMGDPIAVYGYALELTEEEADSTEDSDILEFIAQSLLFSEGYLSSVLQLQWADTTGEETIVGGSSGVSFLGSVLDTEEKEVSIHAHYEVQAILPLGILNTSLSNHYYSKLWTGYEEETASEEMVYITANSEVYHLTDSCSYLRLSVKAVSVDQLSALRNSSGARYRSCSLCGSDALTAGTCYITTDGDCYHTSSSCSGLKRTVYQVPLSQVGDKRPCSRCGGRS